MMNQIQTVLLPTDFSEHALQASRFALGLFRRAEVRFILYHCFMPFQGSFAGSQADRDNKAEMKQLMGRLHGLRQKLAHEFPEAGIDLKVDKGVESRRIVAWSKKQPFALIAMGTKGAGGLKEKLLGSVTADVIAGSACPVLAVPPNLEPKPFQRVLMPTEFRLEDLEAAHFLSELPASEGISFQFIHIGSHTRPDRQQQRKAATFQAAIAGILPGRQTHFSWHTGEMPENRILEISESTQPDLLLMTTYRRLGLFDNLFKPSTTRKVAHHTRIPLLAYPVT